MVLWGDVNMAVLVTILLSFFQTAANSMWYSTVWPPFLKHTLGSNLLLGAVAASNGASELAGACVSGWCADKCSRILVLYASLILIWSSTALVAFAVWKETTTLIFVASATAGFSQGIFFPAVEAIFADCVRSGLRTTVYTVKYGAETCAAMTGYIVTLILFTQLGDEWHLATMKLVIWSACAVAALSSLLIIVLHAQYKPVVDGGASEGDYLTINQGHLDDEERRGLTAETPPTVEDAADRCRVPQRLVPWIVASRNTIVCLGSGMTVMYIGLFLIDDYGASPVTMQIIFIACSLLSLALMQLMAAVVGESGPCATPDAVPRVNRIRLELAPLGVGVLCMLLLAFSNDALRQMPAIGIFALYVVRAAAMNCTVGLDRSIIMDLVPKEERGRWNIFESMSSLSWSGSAVVGGAIADRWGYHATFLVTACIHGAAWMIFATAWRSNDRRSTPRV